MVMTWQNGRQLKSIKVDDTTTLEFTYDINGQRQSKVEKKNGAAVHTTKYYYDGTKLVGENKDGTIVWYDYDENGTPIGMRFSGDDYVFRRNLQGDITGIFDSTGTLVVEYTYGNAWGFGITVSGSKAAEIGACNSLRYRGYYYDSESGLYYLNTRYYDPSICRFVNADTVSVLSNNNNYNTYHLNFYSYCDNSPVVRYDPTGMFWQELWQSMEQFGYLYAYLGGIAAVDGPLPIGDVIAILGVLGITSYAIYLAATTDLSDSLPRTDTRTDEKNQKQSGKYFEAFTLGKGNGIAVYMFPCFDIYKAAELINNNYDVWTQLQSDALAVAIYVSGGFEGPETNGKGNCQHYHLKKRRNGTHIFFGYYCMEAIGLC